MILISEWFIFFSLFLSQKFCRMSNWSRDRGLGLSDEKLISWRRKYDLPCGMQLFDENLIFQYFPNIECHCTTDNFASFHTFEASNQLNPIRIGCSRAFAFHARWLHWHEGHPRDQFFIRGSSSRHISLSMENELSNGVFDFRRWYNGCVLMAISKFPYTAKVRSDGCWRNMFPCVYVSVVVDNDEFS